MDGDRERRDKRKGIPVGLSLGTVMSVLLNVMAEPKQYKVSPCMSAVLFMTKLDCTEIVALS